MATPEITSALPESFGGLAVRPGDAGYDEARGVHNGLIDKRPALIARCRSAADIQGVVTLARETGVELAVRGGGHNVAGFATTDGGVVVDLGLMRGVQVDPVTRRIRVQGGALWGDCNTAAGAHGLATTGGMVSSTGVGGLTLGGGLGWLMGKYGLAADNLVSAEVVTAAGELLTASARDHPDLFWALRGGGGNFGVVTSFEFRAHPVSDVVAGGVVHPASAARDVLRRYRETIENTPDELTAACSFSYAPDGSGDRVVVTPFCHCDPAAADDDTRSLRSGPTVLAEEVGLVPYPVVNTLSDAGYPRGALNYWKAAFVADLDDTVADALVAAIETCPSAMSGLLVEPIHGAVARVAPDATAFPHRRRGFSICVIAQWQNPADTEANTAWARTTYGSITARGAGGYSNYFSGDEPSAAQDAYGVNRLRLAEIKRRYDPGNLFRRNANIEPADQR